MAEHDHDDHEYHRGAMDVTEQARTYEVFGELSKWGSLLTAVAVLVLTLWFCTSVGFVGGAIPGVLLLVAGIVLLRKGPSESH